MGVTWCPFAATEITLARLMQPSLFAVEGIPCSSAVGCGSLAQF